MAADNLKEDFDRDGVVVVRGAVPLGDLAAWQASWTAFSGEPRTPGYNPVAVDGPFPEPLASMYKHPALLDLVEQVFGPDIALYNHRFVVKDKDSRGPVFWHQDTGYHVGWPTKLSCFVALTPIDITNGCLKFMRRSHKFGYLGDAGEIASDKLKLLMDVGSWYPYMEAGDVVLMHSACWHGSVEHKAEFDRVLADIIYQPANDPSGIELLRGEWRCEPQRWLRSGDLFLRSRTSRLAEMQAKLREAGIE